MRKYSINKKGSTLICAFLACVFGALLVVSLGGGSVAFAESTGAGTLIDAKEGLFTYTSTGTQNDASRFTMTADGADFNIGPANDQGKYTISLNGVFTGDFEICYDVKVAAWGIQALAVSGTDGREVARIGWFSNGAYGNAIGTTYATDVLAWVEDIENNQCKARVGGEANQTITANNEASRANVEGDRGVYLSYSKTDRTGGKIQLSWDGDDMVFSALYAETDGTTAMKEVGRVAAGTIKDGYTVKIQGGKEFDNKLTSQNPNFGCPITIYSIDGVSLKSADLTEGKVDMGNGEAIDIQYIGEVFTGGENKIKLPKGAPLNDFYYKKNYGFDYSSGAGKWVIKTETDKGSGFAYGGDSFEDKDLGEYPITVNGGGLSKDYKVSVIEAVAGADLMEIKVQANRTPEHADKISMEDDGLYYNIFDGRVDSSQMDIAGTFTGNFDMKYKSPKKSWGALVFVVRDLNGQEVFTVGTFDKPYGTIPVAYLYDSSTQKYYSRQNGAVVEVSDPATIAYGLNSDGTAIETDFERNALPKFGDAGSVGELSFTVSANSVEIKLAYANGNETELRSLGTVNTTSLQNGYTVSIENGIKGHAPQPNKSDAIVNYGYGVSLLITEVNGMSFAKDSEARIGDYMIPGSINYTITYEGEKFEGGENVIDLVYGNTLGDFTASGYIEMCIGWRYVNIESPETFAYDGEDVSGTVGSHVISVNHKGMFKKYTVNVAGAVQPDPTPVMRFKEGIEPYSVSDDLMNAFSKADVIVTLDDQPVEDSQIAISIKEPQASDFTPSDEFTFTQNKFGVYEIKYEVVYDTDQTVSKTREIYYKKAPVITVSGLPTSVLLGTVVSLPAATATDAFGTPIDYTVSVVYEQDAETVEAGGGSFTASKEGTYKVVYSCGEGDNTAIKEFTVTARKDTEQPTISGEVEKTAYKVGETITLPVLTVSDNSGSVTLAIKIFKGTALIYEGALTEEYTFEATEECVYSVKYIATDGAGNEKIKSVEISVQNDAGSSGTETPQKPKTGCDCGSTLAVAGTVPVLVAAVLLFASLMLIRRRKKN